MLSHAARALRLPLKNLRGMATSSLLAHLPAVPVTGKFPADAAGPVIGTHSGSFHCDEALACGMLHLLPEFRDAPVVRSRNSAEHERCAIVVDVGAVFDAGKLRFDHHQASFTDRYAPDAPTKLSSAGLVYHHYAPALIQAVATAAAGKPLDEPVLSKMVERTYQHFILEIDAIDNGVEVAEGPLRYRVGTGLSSRVAKLNPAWNEPADDATVNARFAAAMALTAGEFVDHVARAITTWLPAREIVAAARAGAAAVHPSRRILQLSTFAPWKEHLFELEAEEAAATAAGVTSPVKRARTDGDAPAAADDGGNKAWYVLYADSNPAAGWRVQAVPVEPEGFACRHALPAAWRGLRDDELSAKAGVPGCVFVHAAGFIGGAKTYEGALALATKALDME